MRQVALPTALKVICRILKAALLCWLLPVLLCAGSLHAQAPAWWTTYQVLTPGSAANDYAVANQGQAKNIASKARLYLNDRLPGGAGTAINTTVTGWATPTATTDDYAVLNVGQLKHLAKPFYDRLNAEGHVISYPWTPAATDDNDYAAVNLGQLKNVFSFSLPSLMPPTGFTATPGNQQVTLSWTAVSGATGYKVKRWNGSVYADFQSNTTSGTTVSDTSVTNGTTYSYVVNAITATAVSPDSGQVSATPVAPPAAPANLTATPGNEKITLNWAAVAGATSYKVRRLDGTDYTGFAGTTFTNTGLVNGTAYSYVVTASNAGGFSSDSNVATATPVAPPAAPTNLTATPGNQQVTLSWTASSTATSYQVRRRNSSGVYEELSGASTNALTYTDNNLINGDTYYYDVIARNAAGSSAPSSPASATPATPQGPPLPPGSVTASPGNAQITISWTASAGATSYKVLRSGAGGIGYADFNNNTVAGTWVTNTGLFHGRTYFYVVIAINAHGNSAHSPEARATTLPQLQPPANLTAIPGDRQVALSWSPVNGATGYKVKRSTASEGSYFGFPASTTTVPTLTDTNVMNGTAYYYVVTATAADGSSAPSSPVSATPQGLDGPDDPNDPNDPNPGSDGDGDGKTDAWEKERGFDPEDPTDVPANPVPQYAMINLGENLWPKRVTASGKILLVLSDGVTTPAGRMVGYRWVAGDLQPLYLPSGYQYGVITDMNDSGVVVGSDVREREGFDFYIPYARSFIWGPDDTTATLVEGELIKHRELPSPYPRPPDEYSSFRYTAITDSGVKYSERLVKWERDAHPGWHPGYPLFLGKSFQDETPLGNMTLENYSESRVSPFVGTGIWVSAASNAGYIGWSESGGTGFGDDARPLYIEPVFNESGLDFYPGAISNKGYIAGAQNEEMVLRDLEGSETIIGKGAPHGISDSVEGPRILANGHYYIRKRKEDGTYHTDKYIHWLPSDLTAGEASSTSTTSGTSSQAAPVAGTSSPASTSTTTGGTWSDPAIYGVSANGMLVATAKKLKDDNGTPIPSADQKTNTVILPPVEIWVPHLNVSTQGDESIVIENGTVRLKKTTTLAIGTLENSFTLDPNRSLVADWVEADPDRFYIRITDSGLSGRGPVKARVWTDSEGTDYDDDVRSGTDPEVVELHEQGTTGVFTSKSMLLTSNDGDDGHSVDSITDNHKNDRTRKIALGGKLKIEYLGHKTAPTYTPDIEAVAPIEKTVKLKFWAATINNVQVDRDDIPRDFKRIQETMAQSGIAVTRHPQIVRFTESGVGIELDDGIDTNGLTPTNEARVLFDWIAQSSQRGSDEVSVIYVNYFASLASGGGTDRSPALSYFPKFISTAKYTNHILVAQDFRLDYAPSHELLHILLDAEHDDHPFEKVHPRMIWSGGTNNASIIGQKRISKRDYDKQAKKMKNNSYAK